MKQAIKDAPRSDERGVEDNERRRQIGDAARRLFSRRGYHGVSVRTISAEAGLKSPAHLYFYFPSKADLYRETLSEMTAPVQDLDVAEAALDRPPDAKPHRVGRAAPQRGAPTRGPPAP